MSKPNPIQIYKDFGTYQLIIESGNEFYESDRYYRCRHLYSGEECLAWNIKEAKKCLEDLNKTAQEIQQAVGLLKLHGYQISKEIA